MSDIPDGKVYEIPKGFVGADPTGRNRYIRRQGTSMELPPRLNPHYNQDRDEQRANFNTAGVVTDLGSIAAESVLGGLGSGLAAIPLRALDIGLGMGGAGGVGLEAAREIAHRDKLK